MDSYRLDYLSSHYVDELDMQVAALEIRARRCFQQERNLYRHSIGIATTKLQQYCLGLVLSHRGPNGAIHALVEEAAMSSGLPVDLWAMHEVKRDAPYAPVHFGAEHPKPNAGSAPQQHGGGGAIRKRAVPRPQRAHGDDSSKVSAPPVTKDLGDDMPTVGSGKTGYNIDSAIAQAGEDLGDLPLPPKQGKIKYLSQEDLQAELRREQKAKEEAAAAQAAADKEEDARLEVEVEKQRKEDAEIAERERATARAKEDDDTAKGVLNPMQQMELDEAREMFRGDLSEHGQKILAEAKEEFGEDVMEWGLVQTKKVLNRILMGV